MPSDSRQRPHRSKGSRRGGGGQEWIWGLLIGGAGIVALLVVVVFLNGGDGGGSPCDQSLTPLGQSPITAAEFEAVDSALEQVVAAARLGAMGGAEDSFFGRVHNFTHNVDAPVRAVNPDLARRLCESVLVIENEFSGGGNPSTIAALAKDLRLILRDAARDLGFTSP